MKYKDRIKLYENKDRFIDGNTNLTDEQKTEIKNFFNTHGGLDSQLIKDWNKAKKEFKYEDFYNLMKPYLERDAKKHDEGEKKKKEERSKKVKDFLDRNGNRKLATNEREALKTLFRLAPQTADDIDWDSADNMSYSDFTDKFLPYQKDYLIKKGKKSDLEEGVDYVSLGSDDMYNYFYVITHKASRILGSNAVPPKTWFTKLPWWYEKHNWIMDYPKEPNLMLKADENGNRKLGFGGASWCIAMPHSDKFWLQYTNGGTKFVFAIANRPGVAEKKVAVCINSNGHIYDYVNCGKDISVLDSKNFIHRPSEARKKSEECVNKIKNYLESNDLFKQIFVNKTYNINTPTPVEDTPTPFDEDLNFEESMQSYEAIRESMRLTEDKHRFIDGNTNLTDEQKAEIKSFFDSHPGLDSQLIKNWDKAKKEFKYEDFKNLMEPYLVRDNTKKHKEIISNFLDNAEGKGNLSEEMIWNLRIFFKKVPEVYEQIDYDNLDNMTWKDFEALFKPYQDKILKKGKKSDLVEGVDYITLGSDDAYNYYYVMTHKAAWILASNNIAPRVYFKNLKGWYHEHNWLIDYPLTHIVDKTRGEGDYYGGASWCIAMPHSSEHWDRYAKSGRKFIFAIANRPGVAEKKVAVTLNSNGTIDSDEGLVNADTDITIGHYSYRDKASEVRSKNCAQRIRFFLTNNERFKEIFHN